MSDLPRPPSSAGQRTGDEFHRQWENLCHRRPIATTELTDRLVESLQHYPDLDAVDWLECEGTRPDTGATWKLTIPDSILWTGKLDLVIGSQVSLYDHKTLSSLSYALKPSELAEDPQAVLYSHALMQRFGVDTLPARWVYVATRGAKKSFPVDFTFAAEHVLPRFRALEAVGTTIAETRRNRLPLAAMQLNQNACRDYGGCPYHPSKGGPCPVGTQSLGDRMSILDTLKKIQNQAQPTIPPAPPVVETTATTVEPVEIPVDAEMSVTLPPEAPKRGRGRPKKSEEAVQAMLDNQTPSFSDPPTVFVSALQDADCVQLVRLVERLLASRSSDS